MRSCISFVLVGMLPLAGCGGSTEVGPRPVPAGSQGAHQITVDLSGVPEGAICSKSAGIRDFCVEGMRDALAEGLPRMLATRSLPAARGPYTAKFQLVELSHAPVVQTAPAEEGASPEVGASVSERWQFTLLDAQGKPLASLSETTAGPVVIAQASAADAAIQALLRAMMERIGAGVDKALAEAKQGAE